MKELRTEVEFIEEWMGNPKGSRKVILTNWAMELVKRGQAALVKKEEKEEKVKVKEKKVEEGVKVEEEEIKVEEEKKVVTVKDEKEVVNKEDNKFKMMGKSVRDKMFKGSKNK